MIDMTNEPEALDVAGLEAAHLVISAAHPDQCHLPVSVAEAAIRAYLASAPSVLAEALEVIRPFVPRYKPWMDRYPDDTPINIARLPTFGHLRAARTFLAKHGGKNDE